MRGSVRKCAGGMVSVCGSVRKCAEVCVRDGFCARKCAEVCGSVRKCAEVCGLPLCALRARCLIQTFLIDARGCALLVEFLAYALLLLETVLKVGAQCAYEFW